MQARFFFLAANGVHAFRIIGDCTYTEHSFIAWLVTKLMSLRPEWQSEVNSAVKTHSYQTWFLLSVGLTKSTQTRPEIGKCFDRGLYYFHPSLWAINKPNILSWAQTILAWSSPLCKCPRAQRNKESTCLSSLTLISPQSKAPVDEYESNPLASHLRLASVSEEKNVPRDTCPAVDHPSTTWFSACRCIRMNCGLSPNVILDRGGDCVM